MSSTNHSHSAAGKDVRKDVVCAIISRRKGNTDFFLIGRRAGTSVMDGYYEFPGGQVSLVISTTSFFYINLLTFIIVRR